ncbi:hypothetical protein DYI25_03965 [Mesobacillus boroniphilus]|uniref:Uncharacterized protein n=1 Tax=Mesobacillus boroniphilus TaxID=308892 RepID=A0A944CKT8_9BACI|nr:hypothetical protein [Mesobacillus boroniphilus]
MIGTEGARLLENANAFSSCVGRLTDAQSMSCGSAGQVRPRWGFSAEEAYRTPQRRISFFKKPAVGLFHNSSQRKAKHPGVEINRSI